MTKPRDAEIAILIYPDAQQSAVLAMTDLFVISNQFSGPKPSPALRVSHWRLDANLRPYRVFDTKPEKAGLPDVIILPPALGSPITACSAVPYVAWLHERYSEGATLASVCAGAFLLAETGLLDGRPATTHWTYQEEFAARFPRVLTDIERLLVDNGPVVTAGGLMSWTDLCLRLLERLRGTEIMTQTARFLLVDPPGREQRYYHVFSPRLLHGDAAVLKVQEWLRSDHAIDASVDRLAYIAGLERRTFLRRFRKAVGMTTSEYIQRYRVGKACELLQFGREGIDKIAWEIGYEDGGSFRRIFHRYVGLTPAEYRKRFGSFAQVGK